ncbi:fad NAD binding oxidoreductase [Neohortaea acidophila]|uniref:Fad NAD binding oxidoreductase n=1 Tax=Neohortaea acidophila TaxID=245834 RepID=A0A6A6PFC4_9PEZI|nr:fad NAD binding oxidoreductase [Neohortaea acidophila]KAF2478689.1 fad NAD binding oxidoreductase [Neohortaea acidophila]
MAATDGKKKHIVIIGGGIIGCTSAYFLSRHPSFDPQNHTITLLEATKIAGGASGKAGGLLALWAYPSSLVPLSYKLHKQLADEHGGEERWGYRALHVGQISCKGRRLEEPSKSSVKGKDGDMDGENGGGGEARVSLQKRTKEAMGKLKAAGMPADLDWVDPDCNPYYDEMGDPSTTAQVHPFQFTTAMAELAKEKGVDVRIGASVSAINYSANGDSVESVTYEDKHNGNQTKTIPATDVIISAGPWTRSIYPQAPIAALRAHSVTIKPSRPISAYALFTQIKLPAGFGQKESGKLSRALRGEEIVTPEIYARPKNEVYACGEGDHLVPLPKSTDLVEVDEKRCQEVVDYVSAISDELRDGEVTARQACYLPNNTAGTGSPLVGHAGTKGLYIAAGHTCWGIQNAPGTGLLMSEFVFDGEAKSSKAKGLDPRNVM